MRLALDSNVLLYFHGVERLEADLPKIARARQVIPLLATRHSIALPVQVLGETYHVLTRKGGITRVDARAVIDGWRPQSEWLPTSLGLFDAGLHLATEHRIQIWDALIITVAAEAGCDLLLSEDMQDGFRWRGLTVVDPFAREVHSRLAVLLNE